MNTVRCDMVASALVLLSRDGYRATTFATVIEHAGAPRGSIYHHFPHGKDEMIEEAMGLHLDRTVTALQSLRGNDLSLLLERHGLGWRKILADDARSGCPVMAVSIDASDNPRLSAAVVRNFAAFEAALADVLKTADVADSQAVAGFLLASYEGAVMLARAERSLARFDKVSAQIIATATALAS